jgi:sugar lactone lactonase YvrE
VRNRLLLLVAIVATGCVRQPAGVTPRKVVAPPVTNVVSNNGGTLAPAKAAAAIQPADGAAIVADDGGGIVANNGSSLTGKVKAPAGIIANNGGSIVANNGSSIISEHGGGIISEHGGGYGLLALPEQQPVANVDVTLLDAGGKPFLKADGTPYVARTDAAGRYAFKDALPTQPFVVSADLGAGGRLNGLAPKPGEARQVDLDLVGTLTSDYILDQYVAWQADPGAVLAKLPPDVEATTRAKAAQAFDAAGAQVPPRLDAQASVRTVSLLRARDPAFDGQLEAVKQLLIAAGQADLGNGRPALEVRLGVTGAMGFGPDGGLYFATPWEGRIWRLTPDGRLLAVAGSGQADHGVLTGKAGPAAGLDFLRGFAFDRAGRMLIVESNGYRRLTRLEADGTVTELWTPKQGVIQAAAPAPDGGVYAVLTGAGASQLVKLPAAGGTPTPVKDLAGPEAAWLPNTQTFGADDHGRLILGVGTGAGLAVLRLDPADGSLVQLQGVAAFDVAGHLFDQGAAVGVRPVRLMDDPAKPVKLADDLPANLIPMMFSAYALAPDGKLWLNGTDGLAFHLYADGKVVAGAGSATGAGAGDLALGEPGGIVPLADGGFVVADRVGNKVYRVAADGTSATLAGDGTLLDKGDGGPATAAGIDQPTQVLADAAGTYYVVEMDFGQGAPVRKIAKDGTISTPFRTQHVDGELYHEFTMAPDGTLYYVASNPTAATVYRVKPGTTTADALFQAKSSDGQHQLICLAVDAAGALWYVADATLGSWTEPDGPKARKHDEAFHYVMNGGLALDARGRAYVASFVQNAMVRWDPASNAVTKLAGPGTSLLAGTGADDSVKQPGFLAFDPHGDLLIADTGHKQVKRIPAAKLQ